DMRARKRRPGHHGVSPGQDGHPREEPASQLPDLKLRRDVAWTHGGVCETDHEAAGERVAEPAHGGACSPLAAPGPGREAGRAAGAQDRLVRQVGKCEPFPNGTSRTGWDARPPTAL